MSAPVQPVVHTPGPWRAGRADKSYDAGIPDNAFAVFAKPEHRQDCGLQGNAAVICVVAKPERMTEEDIANARLISAAPDLLAACLAFLEADNQCGANLAFVVAQEAVKKAGIAPKENGGETCDMKHGPCSCGATH